MEFYYFCAILVGLVVGSFLNVVIFRFDPDIKAQVGSALKGRSHCLKCQKLLQWYELIPLLSFCLQGGKCRGCKRTLSWQYPLVELLGAALAVLALWLFPHLWLAGAMAVVFWLLLVMTGLDLKYQSVEVISIVAAGLIGGLAQLFWGGIPLRELLLGFVVGSGSLGAVILIWYLLFRQQAMGAGDVYIAGSIGLIVGYPGILVALFCAIWLGAITGVVGLLSKRLTLKGRLPFGPFLALGLLITLVWGAQIVHWYLDYSGFSNL